MYCIARSCGRCIPLSVLLSVCILLTSCGPSIVQIKPPYPSKIRPGDGVKIVLKSCKKVSGRATYVDATVIVIRTPEQRVAENPVKEAQLGTTVAWLEVETVKVAGTLDSTHRLISNEEIRINHRSNHKRNFAVNVGLLGTAAAFLIASGFQDRVSSPFDPKQDHVRGRTTFWVTWLTGSMAAATGGYYFGRHLDRGKAIQRIERLRAGLRRSYQDSMQAGRAQSIYGSPINPPPN